MKEHEVKAIAYFLSDGSAASACTVTTALPEIEADLAWLARMFGLQLRVYSKRRGRAKGFRFVRPRGERAEARKRLAAALRRVREESKLSWTKWAKMAGGSYSPPPFLQPGEGAPGEGDLQRLAHGG